MPTIMRQQMPSDEAQAKNTPALRCSSVGIALAVSTTKPRARILPSPLVTGDIIESEQHAAAENGMKPRPAEPYWPTVLIDWCVIQALGKAGWPEQLGKRGDLQAAFVSEVSRYVKFRVLDLREAQAEALIRTTVESVYAELGGSTFLTAKTAADVAQSEFLSALGRSSRDRNGVLQMTAEPLRLRTRMHVRALELESCQRPLAAMARTAAHKAAVAYWR
jgi:hypothetical protein